MIWKSEMYVLAATSEARFQRVNSSEFRTSDIRRKSTGALKRGDSYDGTTSSALPHQDSQITNERHKICRHLNLVSITRTFANAPRI